MLKWNGDALRGARESVEHRRSPALFAVAGLLRLRCHPFAARFAAHDVGFENGGHVFHRIQHLSGHAFLLLDMLHSPALYL